MSTVLQLYLLMHVVLGIVGILCFYFTSSELFKKNAGLVWLKLFSALGALGFCASWITGGFYYTTYYGVSVKPRILEGSFPFAHKIIMEAKEHIFLFLPFLAVTFAVFVFLLGDKIEKDEKIRKSLRFLSLIIFILGLFIAASGILISGAVS